MSHETTYLHFIFSIISFIFWGYNIIILFYSSIFPHNPPIYPSLLSFKFMFSLFFLNQLLLFVYKHFYQTTLVLKAQGSLQKNWREDIKSQWSGSLLWDCLLRMKEATPKKSHHSAYLNISWIRATTTDLLKWMGERAGDLNCRQRTIGN